jgi:hypothetical protein
MNIPHPRRSDPARAVHLAFDGVRACSAAQLNPAEPVFLTSSTKVELRNGLRKKSAYSPTAPRT